MQTSRVSEGAVYFCVPLILQQNFDEHPHACQVILHHARVPCAQVVRTPEGEDGPD